MKTLARKGAVVLAGAGLLAAVMAPAGCTQSPASTKPREAAWKLPSDEAIRSLLADRMKSNGVGVVVGVIDANGRRVVSNGRFSASDSRVPDGETVFQIGSLTKVFTTLLLAEMVQRGEVSLDDPASKYLPRGVTMPQRGRPITLRDLATHMSGLPSMPTNYDLSADPDPYEAYSADQLYRFLSTYKLDREPGERWAYSNLGVSLLGRLLAGRAGTSYEALLSEQVLRPLGMKSTSVTPTSDENRRLAPGHDRFLEPVRTWEMASLQGSGSLRSTANDLLRFLAAYLDYEDTPLKAAMSYQLSQRVELPDRVQALGWPISANGIVRHAGGKQGYRSALAFNRSTGIGAVVLANARTDDEPIDLAVYLVSGTPLPAAPRAPAERKRLALPTTILERYAGHYRLQDGDILEIAPKEHHLLVHTPGSGISEFFATGPRDFFLNTGNDEIAFQVGEDNRANSLILYGSGKDQGDSTLAQRIEKSDRITP
jgi:serine-type D-Ala-D-Ala carboxypeptidase/endopeptidase